MSLCTQILKQIESASLPACVCPTASDLCCDIALLFLLETPLIWFWFRGFHGLLERPVVGGLCVSVVAYYIIIPHCGVARERFP